MKRLNHILLVLIFIFMAWGKSNADESTIRRLQTELNYFEVSIEQNGKNVEIINNTAELKKEPFTVVLHFQLYHLTRPLKKPFGALVNFSFDDHIFRGFRARKKLDDILEKPEAFMGMAEGLFNKEEFILIDHVQPHYFFYKDETEHRFSEVTTNKYRGYIICKRRVSFYSTSKSNFAKIPIQEIEKNNLYVSILYSEPDRYGKRIEKQKEGIHLIFTAQRSDKADYLSLFPLPLKGWEASEVTVTEREREFDLDMDMLFGGEEKKRLILTRTYRQMNKHGATVTIEIDTWAVAYDILIPKSPEAKKELEESGSDTKPFTYQSYNGIKLYENKRLVGISLSLDLCQGFTISVGKSGDKDIIMEYLKKADLQKIHAFMKQH
jgi:hypothetical protein